MYNKHRIPHIFRVDPFRVCEPPEVCLDSEKSKISSEIRSGGGPYYCTVRVTFGLPGRLSIYLIT